eukprot:scaffold1651_cov317-Pinguiococcus_pyrenoidosus.AAC.28
MSTSATSASNRTLSRVDAEAGRCQYPMYIRHANFTSMRTIFSRDRSLTPGPVGTVPSLPVAPGAIVIALRQCHPMHKFAERHLRGLGAFPASLRRIDSGCGKIQRL